MNWDTVIERRLASTQAVSRVDYGCWAIPATFEDTGLRVMSADRGLRSATVLKPHGSINWLYCDACTQLFYVEPRHAIRVAQVLLRRMDWSKVGRKHEPPRATGSKNPIVCPRCDSEALGTRFATFSFRKALEFPMHQATWRRAEELLRTASTWVFIGYSLPAADYEFKHLLKRVQLSRRRPPIIVAVTAGGSGSATGETYRRFFGTALGRYDLFENALTDVVMDRLSDLGALARP